MNENKNRYWVGQFQNTGAYILIDKSIVIEEENKFFAYSLKRDLVCIFSKDWARGKLKAVKNEKIISGIFYRYEKWKKTEKGKEFLQENKHVRRYTENGREFLQENKQARRYLAEFNINYLYHITSKNNLSGIFKDGLLSHHNIKKKRLTYTDISDCDVNVIRAAKHDPIYKKNLHEYVPLYFNHKNAMLFKKRDIQNTLVILCINSELLLNNTAIFTDGNAANNPTRFYSRTKNLSNLNWDIIKSSEPWNKFSDGKRIRMSECLVFSRIKVPDIMKIICIDKYIYNEIQKIMPKQLNINLEIDRKFYF
jgi:hypothetical protein